MQLCLLWYNICVICYNTLFNLLSGTSSCSVKCDHECKQTPKGSICVCKPGYKLQNDNRTCTGKSMINNDTKFIYLMIFLFCRHRRVSDLWYMRSRMCEFSRIIYLHMSNKLFLAGRQENLQSAWYVNHIIIHEYI